MKSINTLVADIYDLVSNPKGFSETSVVEFGKALAARLAHRLSENRGAGTLRASNLGKPCDRQLWFDVHRSSDREALPAAARLKYLFGDILEELLLFLAREAGHDVRHEQSEIDINGVKGHIDGIVDGRLIDCKSASTQSFEKFASHKLADDDSFGYIDQLGSYLAGSQSNPDLVDKDVASFLVIDKTLGHITLDTYPATGRDYNALVDQKREMLAQPEPPARPFEDKKFQESGNRQLGTTCSYCPFKHHCWSDANDGKGLRTFLYSRKIVHLTKVVREPQKHIIELDKNGNITTDD